MFPSAGPCQDGVSSTEMLGQLLWCCSWTAKHEHGKTRAGSGCAWLFRQASNGQKECNFSSPGQVCQCMGMCYHPLNYPKEETGSPSQKHCWFFVTICELYQWTDGLVFWINVQQKVKWAKNSLVLKRQILQKAFSLGHGTLQDNQDLSVAWGLSVRRRRDGYTSVQGEGCFPGKPVFALLHWAALNGHACRKAFLVHSGGR